MSGENWSPKAFNAITGLMQDVRKWERPIWLTPLEKRKKRVYSTVVSGLEKFRSARVRCGFINFTSYHGFQLKEYNRAFTKVRRWMVRYYRDNFDDCKRLQRLEFFRLRTEEGEFGNVYHCLFEMPHEIPWFVLANMWFRCTGGTSYEKHLVDKIGAYVVGIKWCYNWSSRIAGYLVGKYLSRMKHLGGGWMSYSKGWLWSGWRQSLIRLIRLYRGGDWLASRGQEE